MEKHTELLSRLYLQQQVELSARLEERAGGTGAEQHIAAFDRLLPVHEKLRCLCEGGIDKNQEYDRLRRLQMQRLRQDASSRCALFLQELCAAGDEVQQDDEEGKEKGVSARRRPALRCARDWKESPYFRHHLARPPSPPPPPPPPPPPLAAAAAASAALRGPVEAAGRKREAGSEEELGAAGVPALKRPRPAFQYHSRDESQEREEKEGDRAASITSEAFMSAKAKLILDAQDGMRGRAPHQRQPRPPVGRSSGGDDQARDVFDSSYTSNYSLNSGRSLGGKRRQNGAGSTPSRKEDDAGSKLIRSISEKVFQVKGSAAAQQLMDPESGELPEQLRGCDPQLVENIMNEFLDRSPDVSFEDIAGLQHAKKAIQEMIIWPLLRPDLFQGIRAAPKGLLMFGPPGTGKTMIGKAVASQGGCTFFNISASSLMSKWVGEGEKMVRTLFAVAAFLQPTVVFIDEIDSLLCQRSEGDMEGSRRVKTEFLVQMDGAGSRREDVVIVIGATNRPQEIDEAARRRLSKRLYIPLPNSVARESLISHHLRDLRHDLTPEDLSELVQSTVGYSGADLTLLCQDAAIYPIRELPLTGQSIDSVTCDALRGLNLNDFRDAMTQVKASVSDKDLELYEDWNRQFGANFAVDDHRE